METNQDIVKSNLMLKKYHEKGLNKTEHSLLLQQKSIVNLQDTNISFLVHVQSKDEPQEVDEKDIPKNQSPIRYDEKNSYKDFKFYRLNNNSAPWK